MYRWPLILLPLALSCGRAITSPDAACEPGRVVECPCLNGERGIQECDEDGSKWGECECPDGWESEGSGSYDTGVHTGTSWGSTSEGDESGSPGNCPAPELSVAAVAYEGENFHVFFDVGFDYYPDPYCFTTGTELYFDSRIDFFLPGGQLVVSMPEAYLEQPSNLEMMPIRGDDGTGVMVAFGDSLQGSELDPNLTDILVDNPVLDGYVRLCNIDGACDDLQFTLEP